jgi:hypothetical protein
MAFQAAAQFFIVSAEAGVTIAGVMINDAASNPQSAIRMNLSPM